MSFEDRPFILLLLATYALWLGLRRREPAAVALLLTASLLFYGHNHWKLLPILLTYCVVDWGVALAVERSRWPRGVLAAGVTFNLVVLCFYKYTPLVVETVAEFFGFRLTSEQTVSAEHWAIPFGISFYAFTGIAYMVDVYRRTTPAERSIVRYTLSATFFPHLVAGPILRANEYLTSLRPGQMPQRPQAPMEACWLIARGYFKKVVIANRIGASIDPFFAHVADPATAGVWALPYVWLYALQIYFDFSAYTDIARGIGLLFGYRWPDNFNLPYLAVSIADFWRRWHITLSRFLRDYLYIPLGGNRCGRLRTNANLMLTMLLGGLWHGASWSFLVWGGLHGTFLIVHKAWADTALAKRLSALTGIGALAWRTFSVALTFHCVCLAWCFFRLTAFGESVECVRKWFVFDADKLWVGPVADASLWAVILGYGALIAAMALATRWLEAAEPGRESAFASMALGVQWGFRVAVLLLAVLLAPGTAAQPFIYFRF